MQGDVVRAAKWLGGSLVAASLVLVVGFHPTLTSRQVTITRVAPELPPPAYPAGELRATSFDVPVAGPVVTAGR